MTGGAVPPLDDIAPWICRKPFPVTVRHDTRDMLHRDHNCVFGKALDDLVDQAGVVLLGEVANDIRMDLHPCIKKPLHDRPCVEHSLIDTTIAITGFVCLHTALRTSLLFRVPGGKISGPGAWHFAIA